MTNTSLLLFFLYVFYRCPKEWKLILALMYQLWQRCDKYESVFQIFPSAAVERGLGRTMTKPVTTDFRQIRVRFPQRPKESEFELAMMYPT